MSKLFKTTLRVRLGTPEGRKAWGYLVSRDKSKYRSYSEGYLQHTNQLCGSGRMARQPSHHIYSHQLFSQSGLLI